MNKLVAVIIALLIAPAMVWACPCVGSCAMKTIPTTPAHHACADKPCHAHHNSDSSSKPAAPARCDCAYKLAKVGATAQVAAAPAIDTDTVFIAPMNVAWGITFPAAFPFSMRPDPPPEKSFGYFRTTILLI
ncbi:hypothetical protein KDL45_12190 [bacterium]|nr:hypothetical protein [bacterium]